MSNIEFNLNWDALKQNAALGTLKVKKDFNDTRFWSLKRDKNENGSALIRLLPDSNLNPLVKISEYSFKKLDPSTNKYLYYIKSSPATIGLPCPANERWNYLNKKSSLTPEEKEVKDLLKIKNTYICNILILKDPVNPENNGKVFLWKFGSKLLEKFQSVLEPTEKDKEVGVKPIELFNPVKGANILLKAQKSDGYINYNSSTIQESTSLVETEKELKDLLSKTYDLQEFLKPEFYDSYDELSRALKKALLEDKIPSETAKSFSQKVDVSFDNSAHKMEANPNSYTKPKEQKSSNTDDDLAFLNDL